MKNGTTSHSAAKRLEEDIEVPGGWIQSTVAEVGNVVTGNTPPTSVPENFNGPYPWVKPPHLDQSTPITHTEESLSERGAKFARLLPPGTVMVSCIGTLGKVGIAGTMLATNQQINSICFHDQLVLPYYGFYFCKTLNQWLEDAASATTIAIVNKSRFSEAPFLLPPYPEQERIVHKVQELLVVVESARERLARVPKILKAFRQSVLSAAASGRLTEDWRKKNPNVEPAPEILCQISKEKEKAKIGKTKKIPEAEELDVPFEVPSTWALCFFDDLAAAKPNAIKAGPFGSSLTKACYVRKGFKVYGQEQVINGDPSFGDYYISEEKFEQLHSCKVSAGDILVSLVGTIGKVLVIPERFQPGIINPRLVKFSLHPTIVPGYIANYLSSPLAKNILSQQSHGGTMEILNLGIMRKLPIPLPPLPEQQEIVRRVEGLFKLADVIEKRVEAATKRADKLVNAILAKAFRGELVPTEAELALKEGREYEPASKLLERIKAERANMENGNGNGRPKRARA